MTELQRKLLLENLILEKIREIKIIVENSDIKLNTELILEIIQSVAELSLTRRWSKVPLKYTEVS